MKKIIMLALLLLFIVIMGCSQAEPVEELRAENAPAVLLENTSEAMVEEISEVSPALPSGQCASGWKCISSQIKSYRSANCSFGQRVQCPLGCVNDTCKAASVCTSGFICLYNRRAYQTEGCTTINEVECPGGCADGECLPYNATAAAEAAAEQAAAAASAPPPDTSRTLQMGQQDLVTVGETEHSISLSILEESRVKFSVDGFKTDWLEDQESIIIRGLNLTVREILFQSYDGGKQQVKYTVG